MTCHTTRTHAHRGLPHRYAHHIPLPHCYAFLVHTRTRLLRLPSHTHYGLRTLRWVTVYFTLRFVPRFLPHTRYGSRILPTYHPRLPRYLPLHFGYRTPATLPTRPGSLVLPYRTRLRLPAARFRFWVLSLLYTVTVLRFSSARFCLRILPTTVTCGLHGLRFARTAHLRLCYTPVLHVACRFTLVLRFARTLRRFCRPVLLPHHLRWLYIRGRSRTPALRLLVTFSLPRYAALQFFAFSSPCLHCRSAGWFRHHGYGYGSHCGCVVHHAVTLPVYYTHAAVWFTFFTHTVLDYAHHHAVVLLPDYYTLQHGLLRLRYACGCYHGSASVPHRLVVHCVGYTCGLRVYATVYGSLPFCPLYARSRAPPRLVTRLHLRDFAVPVGSVLATVTLRVLPHRLPTVTCPSYPAVTVGLRLLRHSSTRLLRTHVTLPCCVPTRCRLPRSRCGYRLYGYRLPGCSWLHGLPLRLPGLRLRILVGLRGSAYHGYGYLPHVIQVTHRVAVGWLLFWRLPAARFCTCLLYYAVLACLCLRLRTVLPRARLPPHGSCGWFWLPHYAYGYAGYTHYLHICHTATCGCYRGFTPFGWVITHVALYLPHAVWFTRVRGLLLRGCGYIWLRMPRLQFAHYAAQLRYWFAHVCLVLRFCTFTFVPRLRLLPPLRCGSWFCGSAVCGSVHAGSGYVHHLRLPIVRFRFTLRFVAGSTCTLRGYTLPQFLRFCTRFYVPRTVYAAVVTAVYCTFTHGYAFRSLVGLFPRSAVHARLHTVTACRFVYHTCRTTRLRFGLVTWFTAVRPFPPFLPRFLLDFTLRCTGCWFVGCGSAFFTCTVVTVAFCGLLVTIYTGLR